MMEFFVIAYWLIIGVAVIGYFMMLLDITKIRKNSDKQTKYLKSITNTLQSINNTLVNKKKSQAVMEFK